MNICICGGGNLAHALAGELAHNNSKNNIHILTRKPEKWSNLIEVQHFHKFAYNSKIKYITDDYNILKNMDIIILAIPTHARYNYLINIKNYIPETAILITAPSLGGINFIFDKYFPKNKYACLQRVPYICRTQNYGHSVTTDKKKELKIFYSLNITSNDKKNIEEMFNINIIELKNYLEIMLSNSNPILHIAGLVQLLKSGYPYSYIPRLYDIWNNDTSNIALKMDNELKLIMKKMKNYEYVSLLEYYGVKTIKELTIKLKSIESFKDVMAPFIKKDNLYYIDINSRYIIEDIPFGTCFIKYTANNNNIKTPTIDTAIKFIQKYIGEIYINEDNSLNISYWKKTLGYPNKILKLLQESVNQI